MVLLGEEFPNFTADTSEGQITFHDWMNKDKDSWAILFSHPADYTPVCTTELAEVVKRVKEFEQRKVKLIALSCDDVESHKGWGKDVMDFAGQTDKKLPYPIIADPERKLAVQFGMLDPAERDAKGMPLTARAVFIIGSDKKLKLSILYPATTGRNFDEILRVIDSLQLTAYKKVATPVNWKHGDSCMVLPSLSNEEATKLFGKFETKELPSKKQYLRFTKVD